LLCLDFHFAAMILDDALADGKSQSHSGLFACGKKRLENFLQVFLSNAVASISNANYDIFPRLTYAVEGGADGKMAAAQHGVESV